MTEKDYDESVFTPEILESVVNYNLAHYSIRIMREMHMILLDFGRLYDHEETVPEIPVVIEVVEATLVTLSHLREIIDIMAKPLVVDMKASGYNQEQKVEAGEIIKSDERIKRLAFILNENPEEYKARIMKESTEDVITKLGDLLKKVSGDTSAD